MLSRQKHVRNYSCGNFNASYRHCREKPDGGYKNWAKYVMKKYILIGALVVAFNSPQANEEWSLYEWVKHCNEVVLNPYSDETYADGTAGLASDEAARVYCNKQWKHNSRLRDLCVYGNQIMIENCRSKIRQWNARQMR